jgi:hypothetical protein
VHNQIVARTDGVPLFIEELTKTVLESGLLRELDEQFELAGPLPPLAIPSTLHASLLARLDRLASVKDVAQIGAVIGREFSYPLLAAAAAVPEGALRAALAQLVEAELIYQRGVPPDATYVFKHALVQDTSYASLVRHRRQQLHGAIARTLEERFPDVVASEPETLAHHFTEAGLAEAAISSWLRAGRRALQRSAGVEAITHLQKGIKVLSALPETADRDGHELTFQLDLGSALMTARGWNTPDARGVYTRAGHLAHRLNNDRQSFQASWGLWMTSQSGGNMRPPACLMTSFSKLRIDWMIRHCSCKPTTLLGQVLFGNQSSRRSLSTPRMPLHSTIPTSIGSMPSFTAAMTQVCVATSVPVARSGYLATRIVLGRARVKEPSSAKRYRIHRAWRMGYSLRA